MANSVFKVGDIVEGVVTKILPYGVFVILPDNTTGLIHISEIANTFIRKIDKYIHIGSPYLFKILSISDTNFIKGSIKVLTEQEKEENRSKSHPMIYNLTDFGNLKKYINNKE